MLPLNQRPLGPNHLDSATSGGQIADTNGQMSNAVKIEMLDADGLVSSRHSWSNLLIDVHPGARIVRRRAIVHPGAMDKRAQAVRLCNDVIEEHFRAVTTQRFKKILIVC